MRCIVDARAPALVASGERDGTLVAQWQLFRDASLLQEATE
jgi:hypothetical protein